MIRLKTLANIGLVLLVILLAGNVWSKYKKLGFALVELDNKNVELLKLKGQIQEDSLTISRYVDVVDNQKGIMDLKDKQLAQLSRKYKTLSDSYVQLKLMNDSLLSLDFTVTIDNADPSKYQFESEFDLFKIYGTYSCQPPFIKADLQQVDTLTVDISLERTRMNTYLAFVKTNSMLLKIDKARVTKVLDPSRWHDQLYLVLHLPVQESGFGSSIFYKDYGLSYYRYSDFGTMVLNYRYNIGKMFD